MLALLREPRAIDDPVTAFLRLQRRTYPLAHRFQYRLIRPIGLRHHVMEQLVLGADVSRVSMRRKRFDALALDGQHQTTPVFHEARAPIRVPELFTQPIHVPLILSEVGHGSSKRLRSSVYNAMKFMTP